uniref:Uncharacterized protein n=1 Tax=Vespula pensylvanica TaxID=30213 RepID=A0A834U8P5_VESPE|nr:hypothetical protein H0235_009894 [Vespula pensylvanica]
MMLQSICSNGRRSPSSSIRVNEGLRVEGEACHKVERGLGRYALESNEAKLSSPSCIPQAIAPRGNGLKRVEWQMHKTTNHGDPGNLSESAFLDPPDITNYVQSTAPTPQLLSETFYSHIRISAVRSNSSSSSKTE